MLTIRAYEFTTTRNSRIAWDDLISNMPVPWLWDAINYSWGVYAERILFSNRELIILVREGNSDLPEVNINSGELVAIPDKILAVVKDRFYNLVHYVVEYEIEFLYPQKVWFNHGNIISS